MLVKGGTGETQSYECPNASEARRRKRQNNFTMRSHPAVILNTVKPVCNDHLYNEIHYMWFI